jgi:hypothetical protein
MQLFKTALEKLENSDIYKRWKKENKHCYLCSGFSMMQKEQKPWKIGYYNDKTHKIFTFVIENEIREEQEDEIFQKENVKINPLDVKKINFDIFEATVIANNIQKEKYKGNDPIQIIGIVQNLGEQQIWNMILITQAFNTINVKIDAESGDVIEHKINSMMDFRKKD